MVTGSLSQPFIASLLQCVAFHEGAASAHLTNEVNPLAGWGAFCSHALEGMEQ